MRPSFLRVATRPKWIGALFIALAAAAICALLAQWQLGRSIRVTNDKTQLETAVQVSKLTAVGKSVTELEADRRAFEVLSIIPQSCVIVENRFQLEQDGTRQQGYWVMLDSVDTLGAHLWVAEGFTQEAKTAVSVCDSLTSMKAKKLPFNTEIGHYEPSEEVQAQVAGGAAGASAEFGDARVFAGVTAAQLINATGAKPTPTYSGFLVLENGSLDPRLASIEIGVKQSQNQLNLLNAFYAIEWTLFAGFAVFMWFRLVQDERTRIEEESEQKKLN